MLRVDRVAIDDDFFDLGGDSLLAVEVGLHVEAAFGVVLPLTAMFEAPTVSGMARALEDVRSGAALKVPRLVPLRPEGTTRPLFVVSGLGGHAFALRELAQLLSANQRVFGMRPRGLDDRQPPHDRIEDMAAYYIEAIREFAPDGPYDLAGFSAGGIVAYEIAQQLLAAGAQMGLLALIDTPGPGYRRHGPRHEERRSLVDRLTRHAAAIAERRPRAAIGYCAERATAVYRRMWRRAIDAYTPRPIDCRVVLFSAADKSRWRDADVLDAAMGWGELTGGRLQVCAVPGDHLQIAKPPHVKGLADALQNALREAQGRQGT